MISSFLYHIIGTAPEVFKDGGHLLEIVTSLQIIDDLPIENVSYQIPLCLAL